MGQFMWEVVKISCLFECFTCATSFCHCSTSGWAGTRPEKLIRSTRHRCSRQLRVGFSIFEWMFWSLGRGCELWGLRTGKRCSVPRQLKARSLFNFTVKSITCLLPQELKQNGKVDKRGNVSGMGREGIDFAVTWHGEAFVLGFILSLLSMTLWSVTKKKPRESSERQWLSWRALLLHDKVSLLVISWFLQTILSAEEKKQNSKGPKVLRWQSLPLSTSRN